MKGIFMLGPTMLPLFQTYLTGNGGRRVRYDSVRICSSKTLTLIVKNNGQKTDCDDVEPIQAVIDRGKKTFRVRVQRHSILCVCKRRGKASIDRGSHLDLATE